MTYRTFDIDMTDTTGATVSVDTLEAVSRTRSRRRRNLLGHRSSGCHIRGFGV